MTKDTVKAALQEAQEFTKRAKAWLADYEVHDYHVYGTRLGGDLRRQSMELTRALTALRKAG